MHTVRVDLGPRSYDIAVAATSAGLPAFIRRALPRPTRALVVTDTNADPVARRVALGLESVGWRVWAEALPAGEGTKSLASAALLYDRLADIPADRQTPVVAVGGGVVGDLAGFAAATWNRGLPLVMVPTTLLSMVDSSVGGKTGVNHARGKNLIGAFHQPAGVWIDLSALDSLPDREYRSGLGEVVKYGVILDPDLFGYLEEHANAILARDPDILGHVVARCCRLKADVVEKDEREETGLRAVLNYGHTFAHAFEAVDGYGAWLHGEAVAAGMVCASRLAERMGRVPSELTARQVRLLGRFGLPTRHPPADADALLAAMRRDKKSVGGELRFVLPSGMGAVETVEGVPETEVRAVLAELAG